ncbi:hypothetical protein ACQB60_07330 [Actinomycetota bacterium Odt1-20B]
MYDGTENPQVNEGMYSVTLPTATPLVGRPRRSTQALPFNVPSCPIRTPRSAPLSQEGCVSYQLTVRQLIHRLQTVDPDLPVFLAINPDWPYAHRVGQLVEITATGGAVYIAEDGQHEVLPSAVRTQLNWANV